MASGGETGYWPGFVDALSNMVMTLIIIIVLLNVALVYFFYKANKNTSQAVYTAVEAAQKTNVETIEALKRENMQLLEDLKKEREKDQAIIVEEKSSSQPKQAIASNKQSDVAKEPKKTQQKQSDNVINKAANLNEPTDEIKQSQVTPPLSGDTEHKEDEAADGAQAQAPVQLENRDGLGHFNDKMIENSFNNKDKRVSEDKKNKIVPTTEKELIIIYEDDNVEFSPATLQGLNRDLGGLISQNKTVKLEVEVEIMSNNKGYSFSRRLAYYRASSIRNFVLSKGLDAGRIVTRLVDIQEGAIFPRAIIRVNP